MPSFIPDLAHERAFRDALGQFATGVTLVTAMSDGAPLGITANSFAALSLDPPLVLWSPALSSSRYAAFAAAEHFAVHILAADQAEICRSFTKSGSFGDLPHGLTGEGVPVIADSLARFDCVQHATHEGGDHRIIVGRVLRVETREAAPLVFQAGRFHAV